MTESESVALPLGDAPIFSTTVIIADFSRFVNTKFQLFLENPLTKWKTSAIISSVENSGASPSGKATDSDSVIS